VDSFAQSGPAEVEAQYWNAGQVQRLRRLIRDLIVHGAAEKRMRVAHDGDQRRVRERYGPEHCLETPGGAGEKEIAMECLSHEVASA
jgi:hypothetical protein